MTSGSQLATQTGHDERERLLRMLAAVTFLVFFQAYMVAPIIPALSQTFSTSIQTVALIVPAYLIPYGMATLVYGPLADHFGVRRVISASLTAFTVTVKVRTIVSTPPLAVPPPSLTVTVTVAEPLALATGVKVSEPVAFGLV